jgi:hypothetical protein
MIDIPTTILLSSLSFLYANFDVRGVVGLALIDKASVATGLLLDTRDRELPKAALSPSTKPHLDDKPARA